VREFDLREFGVREFGVRESGVKESGVKKSGVKGSGVKGSGVKDMTGAHRLAEIDRVLADPRRNRRWADCDLVLIALMTVLCLIGLVMVLSASSVQSLRQYGSPWYYFEHQALWLAFGAGAFVLAYRVDYHRWRRLGVVAVVVAMVLMTAVLVSSARVTGGGSARWIGVGSWRLQPSELAKLALVLFAADVLDRRADRIRDWRYCMVPVLLAFLGMAVLVMLQPDMGTTMILACIFLACLYVAGVSLRPLTVLLVLGMAAALGAAKMAPYRWRRMTAFWHPFSDAANTGYQSAQGVVALGSGRLFGLGLGATRAATGYLPNQYTDFIYAIIGEETGLLGSLLIVGLFVALAVVGIRVACRAPDRFGGVLAAGITAWLVGEAVINIGAVVGLVPVTGVPLPFVSFGGSSLIIAMGALGMCCNVAKQGLRQEGDPGAHGLHSRRGDGGAPVAPASLAVAARRPSDLGQVVAVRPAPRGGTDRRYRPVGVATGRAPTTRSAAAPWRPGSSVGAQRSRAAGVAPRPGNAAATRSGGGATRRTGRPVGASVGRCDLPSRH
jgi:cell division protein FtsW